MAFLYSLTRRAISRVPRNIRFLSQVSPETGIRPSGGNRGRFPGNIVTSEIPDVQRPSGNIIDTIFENVDRWGSKVAVECQETGRNYTYNQLLDGISKWAGFLTSIGITKGDVIAIYMPNCPEYPIILLGAMSIGVIATTVNNNYTAEELARQLKDSRAKLIVGTPSLETTIMAGLGINKTSTVHLINNGPTQIPGALSLVDILNDPAVPYADVVNVSNSDLAAMPYSSGTTGPPKGVAISHGAFSTNLRMVTHPSVFATRYTTEEHQSSYISFMPYFHIYGMLVIAMLGFHAGVKIITMPVFEPSLFLGALIKHKVEVLHLVPPILNFLVKSPLATKEILAAVKTVIIGAAPVSPSAAQEFKEKFNRDMFFQEGYGMTEILLSNVMPIGQEKIGTCGKVLPNVSAKVIDTATGDDLPPDQTGEICFKTPGMMNGYFQNEAATSTTVDEDGWLHTGDVGFFDDEGYMKVVDRTKELIKVKGLQVSPSELEDTIRQHPEVLDVGVVGVDDERLGEAPRAFIVTKKEISESDIHRFIEEKVAPHKKLAGGVSFVKELPKTATGKLLRRELKIMALSQA